MRRLSKSEIRFRMASFSFFTLLDAQGLKSLKGYWPYLIAFRSCISNGKPEQLLYLMVIFISNFMKSSTLYAASLCTLVRFETIIWPCIKFDISLQNFKNPLDILSHRK